MIGSPPRVLRPGKSGQQSLAQRRILGQEASHVERLQWRRLPPRCCAAWPCAMRLSCLCSSSESSPYRPCVIASRSMPVGDGRAPGEGGRDHSPRPPTSRFRSTNPVPVRFDSNSTRRGYDGHQFVDTSSNRSGVNAAARSAWTCCKRSRMRALLGLGINDPTQHGRAGPRSRGQCGRLITRLFRRSANC